MGPLLFLIYINDMVNVSDRLFYVLFADDSNVFRSGKDIDRVITEINGTLGELQEWLNTNKLTLNVKKTHFIIFTSSNTPPHINNNITINGQVIERVESTRFLGVMVDSKLNFKHHITHIRKKVAKGIYFLSRAKKYFDDITIKELYYAFIHPYLYYCNEVWGSTYSTYLKPIITLQKRTIHIIAGVPRKTHTYELFISYKIIRFEHLYKYCVFIFLYKLNNNLLPRGIQSSFTLLSNNQIHQHNTRQASQLHVQRIQYEARKRALRNQSKIVSKANPDLDYSVSFVTFKFYIKTILYNTD